MHISNTLLICIGVLAMVKSKFLVCKESPKKAFYNLVLTGDKILKVSGITHPEKQVLDKRIYRFDNDTAAEKFFNSKLKEKSRTKRKRVYQEIDMIFC